MIKIFSDKKASGAFAACYEAIKSSSDKESFSKTINQLFWNKQTSDGEDTYDFRVGAEEVYEIASAFAVK